MGIELTPCPACARHVKLGECACPFCGAQVACRAGRNLPATRMSRAALFAASALGTVLGATDCSESSQPLYGAGPYLPEGDAAQSDSTSMMPGNEGGAPSDAAAPSDAGDEQPGAVALYGGFAPVDASNERGESG